VQTGIPLTLTIKLQDAGSSCSPQQGAYVDIWHANAQGAYSDVSGSGNPNNIGVDWLRGYQVSDENGEVTFTTIYPGW
jgi:protocatechuate 3,4-dioxygenase beta subunit